MSFKYTLTVILLESAQTISQLVEAMSSQTLNIPIDLEEVDSKEDYIQQQLSDIVQQQQQRSDGVVSETNCRPAKASNLTRCVK